MIIHGDKKLQNLIYKGKRIYMIFHGNNLVYNTYIIVNKYNVFLPQEGGTDYVNVKSNTGWKIK